MLYIRLIIVLILFFPLRNIAQSKTDTLGGKMMGNYFQKALDDADSLRKLSDSLRLKIDSFHSNPNEKMKNLSSDINFFKNSTIYLSIGLLVFGLILILSILYFLFRLEKGFGNYAFQTIGLVIVVVASLFLVVTGYDKDQITPIIGLLGTIVGFIFGSNLSSKSDNKANDKNESDDNITNTK